MNSYICAFLSAYIIFSSTKMCIAAPAPPAGQFVKEGYQIKNVGSNGVNNGIGGLQNTVIGGTTFGGIGGGLSKILNESLRGLGGGTGGGAGGSNYGINGVNSGIGGTGNLVIGGNTFSQQEGLKNHHVCVCMCMPGSG